MPWCGVIWIWGKYSCGPVVPRVAAPRKPASNSKSPTTWPRSWRTTIRRTLEIQRDLSVSYQWLGDVNLQLGKTAAARDAYQKYLEIIQKLAHDDPQNAKDPTRPGRFVRTGWGT